MREFLQKFKMTDPKLSNSSENDYVGHRASLIFEINCEDMERYLVVCYAARSANTKRNT
jgi:hypothetical protein